MNSKKITTYLLKEIVYVNIKLIILTKTVRWVYYEKHKVDPHAYSVKNLFAARKSILMVFLQSFMYMHKMANSMSHPTHTFLLS